MDPAFFQGSSAIEEEPLDMKCYETKLRRKLIFFLLNPIEKWNARKQFPFKFLVQIIKIMLVTMQLCLFAHSRYNHINYASDNKVTFSHLFLKGWDPVREVYAYPPSIGPLAIYRKNDFYSTLDYAIDGYRNINNSIGPYSYANEIDQIILPELDLHHYKIGLIFGFNESFAYDGEIITTVCKMSLADNASASITKCLGEEMAFSSLVRAKLKFSLKTVNFNSPGLMTQPDCYKFEIYISFENQDMDGQMLLFLDAEPFRLKCKGDIKYKIDNNIDYILRSVLNFFVILICLLSFILCLRAIIRAQQLKMETAHFFRKFYKKELSLEGRWEFWNLWYVMILVNDILIIVGSCLKEEIERKNFVGDQWNTCSVCLGIGNLLVWFGVLRYLGFFNAYNVIILTMRKALPKVIRFLLCALIIYAGFTFCGWLVLGPYHSKFRTLASTSECLFALINGDDMYATFSITAVKSQMLWWFSRIYLYVFISLYIYVVLSLFISIIMDAYETIKSYYVHGFPKNDLQMFILETEEEFSNEFNETLTNSQEHLNCVKT